MAEEEIPIEKLYSQPVVQELLDKVEEEKKPKNIENIKIPYVIKNKVLMSPGVWNNFYYSSQSIKDAYIKTRWDNKEVRSLFLDHLDKSSREWIGEVQNPRLRGEDLVGDLIFVDKPTAQKLAYGAKMGISPKVHGQEDNNKMVSFVYDNFSVVINPAVKTAYINNMEVTTKMAEEAKEEPKAEETPKEETPKEEPKAEAPKEEAPKEEAPKEETPQETESAESIIYAMSEIEAKNASVGEIAKKAKAIRKEGEAWSAAIKRAAKMMADEEGEGEKKEEETKEETPKEEPAKEEPAAEEGKEEGTENKEKTPEMAEADVVSQIIKLAELLKKNQKPEEEPDKDKKKKYPEPEENKEMAKMSGTIKTLSEQVTELTKKLNEPDKVSQKTQELSEADAITLVQKNPDAAFLNALQRTGPGGE